MINEVIEYLKTELYLTQGFGFDFREPQNVAIEAYLKNRFGLFDITCGCGKTLIQACIIALEIERCIEAHKQFVGLFVCHRLMLEDQIRTNFEYYFGDFFKRNNVKVIVLNSTGDNSFENAAAQNMAMPFGEHVLYMTTCASMNGFVEHHNTKYQNGIDVLSQKVFKQLTLYVHDESHKEIGDTMVKAVLKSMKTSGKAYWFTATPGEYLYKNLPTISRCSFAEAVQQKYIVKPVLFPIKVCDIERLDSNAEANCVINAFKHLKRYKRDANGNKETPSLVTFHDSVDKVREIGDAINQYKSEHGYFRCNVYEIVSDKCITDDDNGKVWLAGIRLNGDRYNEDYKLYTKHQILDIIRADKTPKIILSAFMLTEGIDLPEINGVLIACQKSDASLYQAISRGCRAYPGKENYFLYTLTEDGLDLRLEEFLGELVKFTDSQFDFGGIIEDQNLGSTEDEDDDDQIGIQTCDPVTFENVKVIIRKKKTEFDSFKVERNQVEEFRRELDTARTIAKIDEILLLVSKYTMIWSDKPELLSEYCSISKIMEYLNS